MLMYRVKDVADMFEVSEETVRRWIRTEDLKAADYSTKLGYMISIKDLADFTKTHMSLSDLIRKRDRLNRCIELLEMLANVEES